MVNYKQLVARIKEVEGFEVIISETNFLVDVKLEDLVFDDYPYTSPLKGTIQEYKSKRLLPLLASARVVKIKL